MDCLNCNEPITVGPNDPTAWCPNCGCHYEIAKETRFIRRWRVPVILATVEVQADVTEDME